MPVTFHPSTQKLAGINQYFLNQKPADSLAMLKASRRWEDDCKELFQSSFGDIGKSPDLILPSSSGFVKGAIDAYNGHHHLIIRPDDVWITILCQFNFFVNAHAEEVRHLFVGHEGKKELTITALGGKHTANFGAMAEQMGHLIQKNVIDENLRTWIIPDFTTTTDNDIVVASVVMMATLKAYFEYKFSLMCGLPAVTLLGEKTDWVKLLTRIEKLPSFGKETSQWYTLLKPVLTHFVLAFDKPDSQENHDFWQKLAHHEGGGSGPTYLSGWINAFAFFNGKGEVLCRNTDGAVIDGVKYHKIDSDDLPPAQAEVNVKLDDNGQEFKTLMLAGVVGYRVTDSGTARPAEGQEDKHDGKFDTLQPVSGWWLFEEKEKEKPAVEPVA